MELPVAPALVGEFVSRYWIAILLGLHVVVGVVAVAAYARGYHDGARAAVASERT